jgi:hypothetical protein
MYQVLIFRCSDIWNNWSHFLSASGGKEKNWPAEIGREILDEYEIKKNIKENRKKWIKDITSA